MRRYLLIPLLAATIGQVAALEGVEGLDVTFDVISYASQEFSVGYFSDKWSSGNRFEINAMAQMETGKVQPSGGMYFFYEERDWKGDARNGIQESGDLECWGVGLQGGATIHLLPPEKKLWLALVPYARGGIGFMDVSFKDVIIDDGDLNPNDDQYSGSVDSARIEVAAGIDLRLTIAKKLVVVFGGGVDYWSGADVAFYAGTGGGGAAVGSNGTFTGTDAWLRLGVGLHF
jgi:hypothetical protein